MNGYIYVFKRSKDNTACYVGQHNGRLNTYITGSIVLNKRLKKLGRKQFWNYYYREIIVSNIKTIEELNKLEIKYIKKFHTYIGINSKGYNLNTGGGVQNGFIPKKKSIKKMLKNRKWYKHSDEIKRLISKIGFQRSPQTKETIEKRRLSVTGLKRTKSQCKRNGETHSIPVVQLNKFTGKFIAEYKSMRAACKALKINLLCYCTISACCNGKLKTSLGYRWLHKKDYHSGNYKKIIILRELK